MINDSSVPNVDDENLNEDINSWNQCSAYSTIFKRKSSMIIIDEWFLTSKVPKIMSRFCEISAFISYSLFNVTKGRILSCHACMLS